MASGISNRVVPELLDKENYEEWKFMVETYLVAEDLWSMVKGDFECPTREDNKVEYEAWKKQNARALYAIHISCGPTALTLIKGIKKANEAWNILTENLLPATNKIASSKTLPEDINKKQGIKTAEEDYEKYGRLEEAVMSGKMKKVKEIVGENPNWVGARIDETGRTALHLSLEGTKTDISEYLVEKMTPQDLEIQEEESGNTSLSLVAMFGSVSLAKNIVEKNHKLINIPDRIQNGQIPIYIAFTYGRMDMVRFLLKVTKEEDLEQNQYNYAEIITTCLDEKRDCDIALDLLRRCSKLAIVGKGNVHSPLLTLASKPSLFYSGCHQHLKRFWQRWIYNCIHVPELPGEDNIVVNIRSTVEENRSTRGNIKIINSILSSLKHQVALQILHVLGMKKLHDMKKVIVHFGQILNEMCNALAILISNKEKEIVEMKKEMLNTDIKEKEKELKDIKKIKEKAIFLAVKNGITEIVKKIGSNNELMGDDSYSIKSDGRPVQVPFSFFDYKHRTVLMHAIQYRQKWMFNLLCSFKGHEYLRRVEDESGNNMLHIAAMLPPPHRLNRISGAALQMQRELQWFQKVEELVPPHFTEDENEDGMTPREVFSEHHKELVKEGEKWMKVTASSCSVVAALIVTIMFAAVFTIPKSPIDEVNDQQSGRYNNHLYLDRDSIVYIMSDAASLFSSTTSVLMFLRILTSRFSEVDFLESLPKRLIIGLSSLFISVASMMITFCAAIYIMFEGKLWICLPVFSLAALPVTLFVWLQFPLLVSIVRSTYGNSIVDTKTTTNMYRN